MSLATKELLMNNQITYVTRLQGKWLIIARVIWFTIAISSLGLFFISLPTGIEQINEVSTLAYEMTHEIYTPEEFNSFMYYTFIFHLPFTVPMLISSFVALVIFRLRSNDCMAIFVSTMLFTVGTAITTHISGLIPVSPIFRLPADILSFLGVVSAIIFPFVFPDGRFVPKWTRYLALVWAVWISVWFLFPTATVVPTQWPATLELVFYLFWLVIVLSAPIYRYTRVSSPLLRRQTKWVVRGIIMTPVGGILSAALLLVATLSLEHSQRVATTLLYVGILLFMFTLLLVPLSIGISVIRRRLWDIEYINNRMKEY